MAKASPALTNFNAGEFSPLLDGRFDLQKYPNAASVLENFIPTVQGPLIKRPGMRFVAPTYANDKVLLLSFVFSVSQAYVMEFGTHYVRFYTTDSSTGQRGILVGDDGQPVVVKTPYESKDLFYPDGSAKLQYAQSGDVLYICCPNFPVYLLKRTSARTFQMEEFQAKNGPFDDLNDTQTTVFADGAVGEVTLTASADIFDASMEGGLFYLENPVNAAIEPWTVDSLVYPGTLRRSNGCTYISKIYAYTGTVRPAHTQGEEWDAPWTFDEQNKKPTGVKWEYSDPGYGNVRITQFLDARRVRALVKSNRLPMSVVGSEHATSRWAYGSWSPKQGYPTSVAFFRSRLWFARGQRVWASVVEDFKDFSAKNFGDVTADMGINITLASGQINDIQWLLPDKDLIAGTAAGEFAIGELSNGDPLGPGNVRAVLQSEYGSKIIQPVKNGKSILFMQRAGLKAREFSYSLSADGYASTDATILSEHITFGAGRKINDASSERTYGIIQMVIAQEPNPIVWMLRTDYQLIGFTWNNEQAVQGWHRHTTMGDVESIAVIPAFEGDHDELWMSVKRVIDGQERRYIEYLTSPYHTGEDIANQFYVDSGLSYKGRPTVHVYGLDHLNHQEVAILADGAVLPNQVVKEGTITLQVPAKKVQVGLPYACTYRSMRLEAGAADGTAQGKTKRINKVAYRLLDTGGALYGSKIDAMEPFLFRSSQNLMNQPVPLFSGDKVVDFPGDYESEGFLMFRSDQPCAATLLGIYPQLITQDR